VRLQLAIGGIGIELTSEGAGLADEPALQLYQSFLANGPVDLALRIHCDPLPPVVAEEVLFHRPENLWRLCRADGRYLFEIFDPRPPHPSMQMALVDRDLRAGAVYLKPHSSSQPPTWSLPRLMCPLGQILVIHHLAQRRQGLMVHALGIDDRGQGLLFVGKSGAGKSTLANLYKAHSDATVLSDERVIVGRGKEGFFIAGTPWPGSAFEISAKLVPLCRIFFLEHASNNVLVSDRLTNLLGLFFQQLFLPSWYKESVSFALEFAEELLASTRASRLGFVNTPEAVAFLQREISDVIARH